MTLQEMILASLQTQPICYKRVVTEKTAHNFGQSVAHSKLPQYKGMNKAQFAEATKYVSCFTSEVIEC